jgi:predicted ribosome quality control (RQC) complex YloA/Tae2 family protein
VDVVDRARFEAWVASGVPLQRLVTGLGPALAREVSSGGWDRLRALLGEYGRRGPVWEYPEGLFVTSIAHLGEPLATHAEGLAAAGGWLERAKAAQDAGRTEAAETRRRVEREMRLAKRAQKIREDLEGLPNAAELRRAADSLAAALYTIRKGDALASVPDVASPEQTLRLPLDPSLGPGQNLERFYDRVRKIERAKLAAEARLAETLAELETGGPRREREADGTATNRNLPFLRFSAANGWAIWVGRNGRENDRLLKAARPWDLWLHAREAPGAHVLLRLPGRGAKVPEATVLEAAALAAAYSRRAGETAVEVMVVEAERVRKPKGASPGRALVTGERTVRVRPRARG